MFFEACTTFASKHYQNNIEKIWNSIGGYGKIIRHCYSADIWHGIVYGQKYRTKD
jgi:hypothetical protein